MRIYASTDNDVFFKKLIGKDLWVFCNTDYARFWVKPLEISRGVLIYLKLPDYTNPGFVELCPTRYSIRLECIEVRRPVNMLTTYEILEPICEAQGLDVEEEMEYWE